MIIWYEWFLRVLQNISLERGSSAFKMNGAIFHGNLRNAFTISSRIKQGGCLGCFGYDPICGTILRGYVRR